MSCYCLFSTVSTKKSNCSDCLVVKSFYVDGLNSVAPCTEGTVAISEENDYSACKDCDYTITLEYNTDVFSSVGLDSNDDITFTFYPNVDTSKYYEISYSVDCPCSILSTSGWVKIQPKNVCSGVSCTGATVCSPISGECISQREETQTSDPCSTGETFDVAAGESFSCEGTIGYYLTQMPTGLTGVEISDSGVISYDVDEDTVPGDYDIEGMVTCDCGILQMFKLTVTVPDICSDLGCSETQNCDICGQQCVDKESDLNITGTDTTFQNSGISIS